MRIIIRSGRFDVERDLQPSGVKLWEGGDDELPAAAITSMSQGFEPGTWYGIDEFRRLLASMEPAEGDNEVTSSVVAEQFGVAAPWSAAIEIGQSRAALMICRSVLQHAERFSSNDTLWVRID
jgi:hypothetical protein